MAITGTHALLYTSEPEQLRGVLRDVFGWDHVDAHDGWLILALPPAELGVHPAEGDTPESRVQHRLALMCDDIQVTVRDLRAKGVEVEGEPFDAGFGIIVTVVLPGGVRMSVYEPRHPVAIDAGLHK